MVQNWRHHHANDCVGHGIYGHVPFLRTTKKLARQKNRVTLA